MTSMESNWPFERHWLLPSSQASLYVKPVRNGTSTMYKLLGTGVKILLEFEILFNGKIIDYVKLDDRFGRYPGPARPV